MQDRTKGLGGFPVCESCFRGRNFCSRDKKKTCQFRYTAQTLKLLVFQNGDDVGCKREKRAAAAKAAIREKCINVNVKFTTPCPIFFIFLLGGKKKKRKSKKKTNKKTLGFCRREKKSKKPLGSFFLYTFCLIRKRRRNVEVNETISRWRWLWRETKGREGRKRKTGVWERGDVRSFACCLPQFLHSHLFVLCLEPPLPPLYPPSLFPSSPTFFV